MAKLKTSRVVKVICDTCHGNGYVRVAKIDGDPAVDFRDRSEVHPMLGLRFGGRIL
jgi:hypothetical protein